MFSIQRRSKKRTSCFVRFFTGLGKSQIPALFNEFNNWERAVVSLGWVASK